MNLMVMEKETKECAASSAGTVRLPQAPMFFRSFFIQAGWNYERFQNIGFVFALLPALRKIYPDPEQLKAAVLRHLSIFNTQPYMANFVLGNVARMEADAAALPGDSPQRRNLPGVKQALASSFASIGDRIFWGRLKPMTTQVCLLVWALGGFSGWLFTGMSGAAPVWLLLAGPLAGILAYSAVAVTLRWRGLGKGYACGGTANCGLDSMNWQRLIRGLSAAGFALSIALAVLSFGMLAGVNYGVCSGGALLAKLSVCLGVLVLHRVTRAFGRSSFFAAGVLLAVSVLLFSVLKLAPFNLYL
ncbi:MAG TPA: PTS system mannose/fructose/sorbose family transporter subunit IID [Elusimicrobiales bacterium]|nr:PTS system mannose/fructose/sorbose family transporter subunit IID [Elusimicrobiales bacterium]